MRPQNLLNVILDKIQISVNNVHVRFENDFGSERGHAAIGVTLRRLLVDSVFGGGDEWGEGEGEGGGLARFDSLGTCNVSTCSL